MRGKSIIISCLLLALVLLSATAIARIHFGPLFGVLIVPQNNTSGLQHTDFLVGGSAFFPLERYFGFVVEGGARMVKFNFDEKKTKISLLVGGGGRFYPLPGKVGIIDPYIATTVGFDSYLLDYVNWPIYIRLNLGSNITVKGMKIIPYIEFGVVLEATYYDSISVINITTGFLF